MKVKIEFSGTPEEPLPDFKDNKEVQVDFSGNTIKALLHHLSLGMEPQQKEMFLNDRGEIPPTLFVYINGEFSGRLNATLRDDDLIKLIFVSGG